MLLSGQESANYLSISQQPNGPVSQRTSESETPLTSTISAPADSFQMKQSFSLATPNEPFSAPADLAVDAQMATDNSRRPPQLQSQEKMDDQQGSSGTTPSAQKQMEPEVYNDFSI